MLCAGAFVVLGWVATTPAGAPTRDGRLALAVIGDSDSHAYQDRISFPEGGPERGGAHRDTTLNWVEALARLRGDELDPGGWGAHGVPGRVARVLDAAGIELRRPRKQDYRFNFAVAGAGCGDLLGGYRQVPALLGLMDEAPARWRHGVVVIRIGINSFGTRESLRELAEWELAGEGRAEGERAVRKHAGRDLANGPPAAGRIADCVEATAETVRLIHDRHPATRIVLVGIFDNTHWAPYLDEDLLDGGWTPAAQANIARALDRHDRALREMARADDRVAFFDDRGWFAAHWGGRDPQGRPAYRELVLPGRIHVSNSIGDAPRHAILQDGHAGTAWSAAWAQSLVALLNRRWRLDLTPISDDEVSALVRAGPVPPR